ncbi:MAG TPA: ribonuclease III domain-containing protein [Candidatus Obscuribacterales bacterium]
MFLGSELDEHALAEISLRQLAMLGDAVFHLFERERQLLKSSSAREMHSRARVSAKAQASLLAALMNVLSEREKDLVRRARNVKPALYRRSEQSIYRQATAFEALLGYLYLTDNARLRVLLEKTTEFVGKTE